MQKAARGRPFAWEREKRVPVPGVPWNQVRRVPTRERGPWFGAL
jgi:hypothetical protein